MATASAAAEQIVIAADVPWEAYAALVRELGDHSRLHVAYSEGTLEIMSPSAEHECLSRLIDALIVELSVRWEIDVEAYGSTTLQLPTLAKGAEPDSCYYVQRASTMRGRLTIDLLHDPAPDVVLEVDLTSSRIAKNAIYDAMKVPEIWRHDGNSLRPRLLTEFGYVASDQSVAFPSLSFDEIDRHIAMTKIDGRRAALVSWNRWLEANRPPAIG